MSVLYIVVPIALLVLVTGISAFVWAVRAGQFDDLKTPAMRMLHDELLPRRPRIEIIEADTATLDIDAIADVANDELRAGSRVAVTIQRVAGKPIEPETVDLAPIDEPVATSARAVDLVTRRCLEVAAELGAKSIALPAFGTGVGGFPVESCARRMITVIRRYTPPSLERVCIAVEDGAVGEAFERALRFEPDAGEG